MLFNQLPPELDSNLSATFVSPTILPALLNPESTLLAAPTGYGKSTLAFIARQQLQSQWLQVSLDDPEQEQSTLHILLRQISMEMWQRIQNEPARLADLRSRAVAVRYFLDRFADIELDYLLSCLADDFPEHSGLIQTFQAIEPKELFTDTATDTQRLKVLCDCVQRLGFQGVIVWFDLSSEFTNTPVETLQILQDLFGSLQMVRQQGLHIKCLAPPSICQFMQRLRGLETLSVHQLSLGWTQEQLYTIVEKRLHLIEHFKSISLNDLVSFESFQSFLNEYSDINNPTEWLLLTRLLLQEANKRGEIPLSEENWNRVKRSYFAERVKIRIDEQGEIWRGKQRLQELSPRKRALYPLLKYLYEHPGVQRTYKLTSALDVDETNLNTMISRLRKEHLEPFPETGTENEEWIYLVTDAKGGGYELRHTDRSP